MPYSDEGRSRRLVTSELSTPPKRLRRLDERRWKLGEGGSTP